MQTLEFRIKNFVINRVEDVGQLVSGDDSEYRKEADLISSLMDEIKELLPKEKKHLIDHLDEHNNSQFGIMELEMYKQGFKDGFKFNNFLGR